MSLALATPDFDIRQAKFCAALYHDMGYNPLPSQPDRKRPALRAYSRLRDQGIPPKILDRWWAPNVQLCLGARWDLCVVDLDGSVAVNTWRNWTLTHPTPPTWAVQHDPEGGMHLWFRMPEGGECLPFKSVLWDLPLVKHASIELLGDRNLVVAPPSRHPASGRPYSWLPGLGPSSIHEPARLPRWVLDLIPANPEPALVPLPRVGPVLGPLRGWYDRNAVLDAIPDKVSLAESWGLRLVSRRASDAGWIVCRAVGRPDENPSAKFSIRTGRYQDFTLNERISLFDLAVRLGAYTDWASAVNDLGRRYHVHHLEARYAV